MKAVNIGLPKFTLVEMNPSKAVIENLRISNAQELFKLISWAKDSQRLEIHGSEIAISMFTPVKIDFIQSNDYSLQEIEVFDHVTFN